jgi:hypothetical protein
VATAACNSACPMMLPVSCERIAALGGAMK